MSVVRYFNNPADNEKKEYKIGKIRDLENQEFKFYELSRTDIMKNGNLQINIDVASKTICTSVNIDFTTEYMIEIDGDMYNIRSIYVENLNDDNNFFRIHPKKRTYLILIQDR